MSLLADLLSKIKPYTAKGDVPPGLKIVVSDSAKKETARKKVAILSVLVILAVTAGIGAVYLMDIYLKPSKITRTASSPQPAVIESPKTEVKAQEQQPGVAGDTTPKISLEAETKSASHKTADKKDSEAVKDKAQPSAKTKERSQAVAGKRKKEPADKSVKQAEMEREGITENLRPKPKNEVKPQKTEKPEYQEAPTKDKPAVDASGRDVYLYTARTYELRRDYQQALLSYKKAIGNGPRKLRYHE